MGQPCRRCGQTHDPYAGCLPPAATRSSVVDEDESLVGRVVSERYQVGSILGQGATGTVFNVHHVNFAHPAAMKTLRPRFVTTAVISHVFRGEARTAWSVSHPNLCEVFD